jgi:23S rRNA (adenine2503-C2)-methyltransferase
MPGAAMNSAALELNEAERARIMAKAAAFAPPAATLPDGRRDLVGLSREELAAEMVALGEKPFRSKQLWHWLYHQGETDFARMNTIAKPMQMKLAERFVVGRPEVATQQDSADGTRKWLFRFRDQQRVETVYIPSADEDRGAVCISTQVGCTLSCRFCHTRFLWRMAKPQGWHPAPSFQYRRHGHG